MQAEWDESFFDVGQREDASLYWVCFWNGDDIEHPAQHDPHRVTGARSVEEVLEWVHRTKGDRRFELFVEMADHAESPEDGWVVIRNLVRLAGDFHPAASEVTIPLTDAD